jgi:hypothetical protein
MVTAFKMDDTKKLYLKFIITLVTKSTCSDMVYGVGRYTCKPNSMLGGQQHKSMANATEYETLFFVWRPRIVNF